jgi:hypothetical protein
VSSACVRVFIIAFHIVIISVSKILCMVFFCPFLIYDTQISFVFEIKKIIWSFICI